MNEKRLCRLGEKQQDQQDQMASFAEMPYSDGICLRECCS
jgi:hypothetical protein